MQRCHEVWYIIYCPVNCSGSHSSEAGIIFSPFPNHFIYVDIEISGTKLISSILYFKIYFHQLVFWIENWIFE